MQIITLLYSWLPGPLSVFVVAVFGVFAIIVLARIVKIIVDIFNFVKAAIVALFV